MTLLDRVKELCKQKGISQSRMEKEIEISNGASSKWKNSSPSLEILKKLSNYFNVSVDYLMNGGDDLDSVQNNGHPKYYIDDETVEMAQDIKDNKELKLLFDAARNSSPEDLQTVHQMLLALKKKERGE